MCMRWYSRVLVEYVPTSFGYVFHAGTHFSNTRPVECRRPAAVPDTQHTCAGICSTFKLMGVGVYCRAVLGVVFLRCHMMG